MKNLIIILICFIVSVFIYISDFSFTLKRKLKYHGCSVSYSHIYLRSDRWQICENNYEEYNAHIELLKCLCEQYVETRDSSVRNYIMNFYMEDPDLQKKYKREILFKIDTGLILKNREVISEMNAVHLMLLKSIKRIRKSLTIY